METSKVKLILGINDDSSDELLSLLLKKCEMWVRSVCGIFDVDESLELIPLAEPLKNAVVDLCVVNYNKLGSEGLMKEAIGPLTMDYCDIPHETATILNRYKRVRF